VEDRGLVLIATADESARELTTRVFERAGFPSAAVMSGEEAVAAARKIRPILVVLDVELPGISGYEACYELREEIGEEVPIIFVSGQRTDPTDRVAGLLIGGDDYLTKPFDADELLVRARRLISRRPTVHELAEVPLTDREVQILQLLASGLSQERIARELFISAKTVATHIQRILTKLGVHSRTEAVALAYRSGLVAQHR
jgi:DNA-binding NarL/FixJ family response regulator